MNKIIFITLLLLGICLAPASLIAASPSPGSQQKSELLTLDKKKLSQKKLIKKQKRLNRILKISQKLKPNKISNKAKTWNEQRGGDGTLLLILGIACAALAVLFGLLPAAGFGIGGYLSGLFGIAALVLIVMWFLSIYN